MLGFAAAARAQTGEPLTCEDYRCMFQESLQTDCQCTDQSDHANHGRYVSCVAHAIKDLVDKEGMPVNCKGKLQRCAARSVCGKQNRDFHTCTTFEYGTCTIDSLTGLGACSNDPLHPCLVDTDCVISEKCKITRHPENCTGEAQFLDLAPTCCSTCAVEPAAPPVP